MNPTTARQQGHMAACARSLGVLGGRVWNVPVMVDAYAAGAAPSFGGTTITKRPARPLGDLPT